MASAPESGQWADKEIFTTGEAAAVCGVSQQTIIRCFDAGRLDGFRVPGSRFRRIPRESLLRFMRDHAIDASRLLGRQRAVLLIAVDQNVAAPIMERLAKVDRTCVTLASNAFEAGVRLARIDPVLIFIDGRVDGIDPSLVAALIHESGEQKARVVVLLPAKDDTARRKLLGAGIDEVLIAPSDPREIADRLLDLLDDPPKG